jgi:hypothetical protein
MGMNIGHPLTTDGLKIRKVTHNKVIVRGACGEVFNISVEEWPKLRSMLNAAMRKAKKLPQPVP